MGSASRTSMPSSLPRNRNSALIFPPCGRRWRNRWESQPPQSILRPRRMKGWMRSGAGKPLPRKRSSRWKVEPALRRVTEIWSALWVADLSAIRRAERLWALAPLGYIETPQIIRYRHSCRARSARSKPAARFADGCKTHSRQPHRRIGAPGPPARRPCTF